jgi:hypothetical protein
MDRYLSGREAHGIQGIQWVKCDMGAMDIGWIMEAFC